MVTDEELMSGTATSGQLEEQPMYFYYFFGRFEIVTFFTFPEGGDFSFFQNLMCDFLTFPGPANSWWKII